MKIAVYILHSWEDWREFDLRAQSALPTARAENVHVIEKACRDAAPGETALAYDTSYAWAGRL